MELDAVLFTVSLSRCSTYEDRLKSPLTSGSAPLLYRGIRWLLCHVVVVGIT